FTVGIKKGLENPVKEIEVGDIAYWPLGDALCIFFGKIEPYSEVNPVGKIIKGLELFSQVRQGTKIRVGRI
nr:cyclophilin-like fold protein [Candidatus Freyrarchaeum guaymaensis]